jgi:ABC-type bacteriocin/lantibiotic exporter with double-glycine peptidase domain
VSTPDPAIRISCLTVRFGNKIPFRDFSLDVAPGERAILTGESGLGKSTLLKCLLGFTVPESGKILIDGIPLSGESVWRLRSRMAYVPQEPELGEGTLREWFEQPFFFKINAHLKENLSQLPGLLGRLSLSDDLLDAGVETLSGGEKQRAALISALLLDRKILILDEPTSALDSKNSLAAVSLLQSLNGITILGISHDTDFLTLANRVIPFPPKGA